MTAIEASTRRSATHTSRLLNMLTSQSTQEVKTENDPADPDPPEAIEISKTSFKLVNGKIRACLQTKSGSQIVFVLPVDKFLLMITAAVACLNTQLGKVFDLIGFP